MKKTILSFLMVFLSSCNNIATDFFDDKIFNQTDISTQSTKLPSLPNRAVFAVF
ncbi:MAG: hypothetical protein KatS3mg068_1111 [Candidatus Sericytochromatia bacterium]|nr:MAG: hypothetical protein KatS3mg068_1111 [Candidatus Sericytochromatia bacterium]